MPLYEYACTSCTHEFETLVRNGDTPACPACHATTLERRLSVFAAHSAGSGSMSTRGGGSATSARGSEAAASMGGCGHCGDPRGAGACSMN